MLKAGEKLWDGAIVSPQLASAYNAITRKIESFEAQGKRAPDYLLNGRHNLIANVNKGE